MQLPFYNWPLLIMSYQKKKKKKKIKKKSDKILIFIFKPVLQHSALKHIYYHSNLINRFIWGISQLIESWSNHHHCIMLMEMRLTFQSKQDVRRIKTAKKCEWWSE